MDIVFVYTVNGKEKNGYSFAGWEGMNGEGRALRGVTKNKLIGAPRRAAAPPLRAALIFALRRFAAPRFKRQSNFYALCDGCIVMLISQVLPNVVRRQRGRPATRRIDIPSP